EAVDGNLGGTVARRADLEAREVGLGVAPHQAPVRIPVRITETDPIDTLLFICTGTRRSSAVSQIHSRPLFLNTPPALSLGSTMTQSNLPAGVSMRSRPMTFTSIGALLWLA